MDDQETPEIRVKLRVAFPDDLVSSLSVDDASLLTIPSTVRESRYRGHPIRQLVLFSGKAWDVDVALEVSLRVLATKYKSISQFVADKSLARWFAIRCEFTGSAPSIVLASELLEQCVNGGFWLDIDMDYLRDE